MRGRLRAFPHALPLPAPQRDGVSPHSLPPCPPVQRVPLPSGKSRHFTLSLRRVYVAAISDVQATQRSGGPLSVISSRLDENRRGAAIYGRNCYLACQELGVKPPMRYLDDDTDVVDFVLSANMSRQNLDTGQRAMVMAAKDKLRWGE